MDPGDRGAADVFHAGDHDAAGREDLGLGFGVARGPLLVVGQQDDAVCAGPLQVGTLKDYYFCSSCQRIRPPSARAVRTMLG